LPLFSLWSVALTPPIRGSPNWREQWFKKTDGGSFYVDLTAAISPKELERRA